MYWNRHRRCRRCRDHKCIFNKPSVSLSSIGGRLCSALPSRGVWVSHQANTHLTWSRQRGNKAHSVSLPQVLCPGVGSRRCTQLPASRDMHEDEGSTCLHGARQNKSKYGPMCLRWQWVARCIKKKQTRKLRTNVVVINPKLILGSNSHMSLRKIIAVVFEKIATIISEFHGTFS